MQSINNFEATCSTKAENKSTIVEDDLSFTKTKVAQETNATEGKQVKVFSMISDYEHDEFMFNLKEVIHYAQSFPVTKRSLFKWSSKKFFILTAQRLASRRGLPATTISDNAKTFKSACKEIRKITRDPEVWWHLTENKITWKFIIEKAPWWGGLWEQLVRSIKRPIKKILR